MIVYVLCAIVTILFIIDTVIKYNKDTYLIRQIPGPRGVFVFGNALSIIKNPVDLFYLGRKYAKGYNGIYSWYAFHLRAVNIYNPEDIETVTSTMKHSDKSHIYAIIKPWLREGLLLSNGAKWQSRRKILTPTFHFNVLRQFWPLLEENGQRLVEILEKSRGKAIDVVPVISEYTLNAICETAMGTKLHEQISNAGKTYKNAIYKMGPLCVNRFTNIVLIPELLFNISPTGRKTYKQLDIIQSFTKSVIKEREEYIEKNGISFDNDLMEADDGDDIYAGNKKKKIAMLDLLLSAEKEGIIDRDGIQEEVDTFMFEGHDTTAAGLTYCLMLLANHRDVQEKIQAEMASIFGDSGRAATMEDLSLMRYMECCIKESLRLYPPVPFISREVTEDTKLSNYTVPKGANVHIHIYDLHRCEKLYKDPLKFDPDRFLPENSVGRHPYAYIPFSAGPRNCIGQKFAMMEMKSCLAWVLRKFDLEPVTVPEEIEIIADIVLRGNKPVLVKFVDRKNKDSA